MKAKLVKSTLLLLFTANAFGSDLDAELDVLYSGGTITVKPLKAPIPPPPIAPPQKIVTKTIVKKVPQIHDRTVNVTFHNYGYEYTAQKYFAKPRTPYEDEAIARVEEDRLRAEIERMKHPERFL